MFPERDSSSDSEKFRRRCWKRKNPFETNDKMPITTVGWMPVADKQQVLGKEKGCFGVGKMAFAAYVHGRNNNYGRVPQHGVRETTPTARHGGRRCRWERRGPVSRWSLCVVLDGGAGNSELNVPFWYRMVTHGVDEIGCAESELPRAIFRGKIFIDFYAILVFLIWKRNVCKCLISFNLIEMLILIY